MTSETFESRLRWLRRSDFEPVSFRAALERLKTGAITGREIVITIDDGFFSVMAVGWPLLKAYGFPATLYVTTYYTKYSNPIFRLALQYMVWKTTRDVLDLPGSCLPLRKERRIRLKPFVDERSLWNLTDEAEAELSEEQRVELATRLGEQLGIDYKELRQSRRLNLLTKDEISTLDRDGLDIQLHTHRHRLPLDANSIRQEIADNRRVLAPLTSRPLVHLCYPSGIWSESCWQALAGENIETAVTCDPGINRQGTPPLALRRVLDAEEMSLLDYEAELSGLKDIARALLRRNATFGSHQHSPR